MGQLITLLKGKEPVDVFIDFENAKPSEREQKLYNSVAEVLDQGKTVLKAIDEYKGCQDLVRKAMQTPNRENEAIAFEGLLSVVDSISLFFTYAKRLEETLPILLDTLARPTSNEEGKEPGTTLESQQALAKQLADIFDFTLRFDALRMMRPNLSNDFSYYRRLLPKFANNSNIKVKDDEAGGMALFTAEHIPMMGALCRAANKAIQQNEAVVYALAVMANSCLKIIRSKKFEKVDTNLFIARAMTGSIVLFDHVDALGAFHKKSPIAIKACILLLQKEFPKEQSLLNAIQFSSKTFKNAPDAIQELFNN
jgi:hypothetical protein